MEKIDPLKVDGVPLLIHDYMNARIPIEGGQMGMEVDLDHEVPKPPGIRAYLGTTEANGEPSVRFDDRITRCNELANYALVYGDAPKEAHLIHGSMHGRFDGNIRIRHAWLTLKVGQHRLVWEPIHALWHRLDDWYEYARAWDEREYTRRQAMQLTYVHNHYGPWHESRYN